MAELKFIATIDTSQFKHGAQQIVAEVKQVSGEVKKEGNKMQNSFDGIGKSMGKALAAFGGAAIFKSLVDNVVKVRGEFQKTAVAIETLLGNKQQADELLAEVKDIAAKSPLQYSDITKATQQMLSFNIEAEKVPGFIRAIGDVSMGNAERFSSLALAFSQMSATGKLMGQDLLQMINAGFNPLATIADKTGKSIGELKEQMSQGAISAEMVQQAFIDATSAGGKFFGMSENTSKTVEGQISMLHDAIDTALNEVGEASEGIITGALSGLTTLVKNYEKVAVVLGTIIANYGVYKAAVALVTATESAHSAVQVIATARTLLLEKAQKLLNTTMLANPYVAAAMALTTLVGILFAAASGEDKMEKATNDANEALEQQAADLEDRKQKIGQLINTIKSSTATKYEQIEAYEELKVLAPELTKQYTQEQLALADLAEMQKAVNKEMDDTDYSQVKQQVETLTAEIERYKRAIDNIATSPGGGKQEYQTTIDVYNDRIAVLQKELEVYQDAFDKMEAMRKQAEEEAKPIELRIKEADENVQVRKNILDFFDGLMVAAKDVEDSVGTIRFESAQDNFDKYIKACEKEVADLKKKVERNPMDVKLNLEYSEKQKILNEFLQMKADWVASGANVIPIVIKLDYQSAQGALDAATAGAAGLAQYRQQTKSYKQAYTDAYNAYVQAQRNLEKAKNGTLQEYKQAKEQFDTAEKAFKEVGGEVSKRTGSTRPKKTGGGKSKQDIAEEQAKQRAAQIQEERRLEEEREQLAREAEYAVADAKIAAIRNTGMRERAAEDEQHRRRLKEIRLQADEYAKQQYENNKKAWELTHKKGVYEDTDEGKAGWQVLALTDDQRRIIEAQVNAEESAYERILQERKEKDAEAMREYLRNYGTYQERRVAIIEDYDKKISDALSEGDKKSLQAQKEAALEMLDRDFGLRTQQMADLFEDASDKSVKSIDNIIKKYETLVAFMRGTNGQIEQNVTLDDLHNLGFSDEDIKKVQTGEIKINDIIEAIKRLKEELSQRSPFIAFTNELEKSLNHIKKGKVGEGIQGIGNAVTKFLPAVKQFGEDIANIFGFSDSAVQGVIDAVGGLGQAAAGVGQIMSGDIIGGIMGTASGISTIVSAVEGLFGADYSSYEKLVEQYERLIDVWDDLLDAKREYLDESYGAETLRAEKEITDILNKETEAWRELGKERLNAGASIGSHSIGRRIMKEMTSSDWTDIGKALGGDARRILGDRLTGLFDLSSDQLKRLKEQAPAFWAKMDEDVQKYLQGIIDGAEKLEEVQQQAKDRLTQTTFDAVRDDFLNKLADMSAAASDFSDNFAEMLFHAMLNTQFDRLFADRLNKWYDQFADAMKDSELSESERSALLNDYNSIVADAMQLRDTLADATGYRQSDSEGSGAYSAAQSFTQDQADELNGRLAAIQIGQTYQNEQLTSAVMALQSLSIAGMDNGTTLAEMRNLMLIGNGHLEDIARYTRIASQFGQQLDLIADKIKTL